MFLEIIPTGKKVFRLPYRLDGKQRTAFLGDYPELGLADARLKAATFKMAVKKGMLLVEKKLKALEPTAPLRREITKDYLMLRQRSGAAPRMLAKLDRQIGITIDKLGDRAVNEITSQDMLGVVNPIAEQGHVENAHEICSRFLQIFRYAPARGLVEHDPAALTIGTMIKRNRGEIAGISNPKQVGKLMWDIPEYRERYFVV